MKRTTLTAVFLAGLGTALAAQAPVFIAVPAQSPTTTLSLEFSGDSLTTTPANGYDGVVREGPADNVVRASGNALVIINGTRISAESISWHWGSNEIELNGGSVRIALAMRPTAIKIRSKSRP